MINIIPSVHLRAHRRLSVAVWLVGRSVRVVLTFILWKGQTSLHPAQPGGMTRSEQSIMSNLVKAPEKDMLEIAAAQLKFELLGQ